MFVQHHNILFLVTQSSAITDEIKKLLCRIRNPPSAACVVTVLYIVQNYHSNRRLSITRHLVAFNTAEVEKTASGSTASIVWCIRQEFQLEYPHLASLWKQSWLRSSQKAQLGWKSKQVVRIFSVIFAAKEKWRFLLFCSAKFGFGISRNSCLEITWLSAVKTQTACPVKQINHCCFRPIHKILFWLHVFFSLNSKKEVSIAIKPNYQATRTPRQKKQMQCLSVS